MRQPKREGSACKDHQPERPDQRVCVDGVGRVSRNHLPRQLTQGRPCWCPARLPGAPSLKSWSVQISHIDMLCGECQWLGQVADLPERLGHDVANVFEQSFNIHDFEVEPSSQAKTEHFSSPLARGCAVSGQLVQTLMHSPFTCQCSCRTRKSSSLHTGCERDSGCATLLLVDTFEVST